MLYRVVGVTVASILMITIPQAAVLAEDSQPSTVVEVPQLTVTDPCNDSVSDRNAAWNVPENDSTFMWEEGADRSVGVQIIAQNTTFADGSTWYGYGLPTESGDLCKTDNQPPTVAWTDFEKRCMREGNVMTSAHRGMGVGVVSFGGRRYAENTVPALARGLTLGVCTVETDYWVTRDGCIMSHHDADLRRMTNRRGQIRRSDCQYVSSAKHATGAAVPTFQAVQRRLNQVAPWTCFRQQEIKRGSLTDTALKRMVSMNRHFVKSERCIMYTSAELSTLRFMHQLSPQSSQGMIIRSMYGRPKLSAVPRFVDRIMLHYRAVTPRYVRQAARAGFEVSARSVNSLSVYQRMKSIGVRYIVTDKPGLLRGRR